MLHGGQISRRQTIFSADGKLLCAPCGNTIRLYGASTSECVGTLEGHTDEVTCVAVNPQDASQLYSGSRDGTLRLWDLSTHACVRMLTVREPVRSMSIYAPLNMAYLSIEWRDGVSGRVICYSLDKGRPGATAMKTRAAGPLSMASPNGKLVATVDRHSLFVWRAGPEISQPLNLHHTRPYTCVAMSADETMLAAGDVSGRILIWRNVGSAVPTEAREGEHAGKARPDVEPALTTVHWHAGPVGALSFSPDGTTLLSGGREGVLVLWNTVTHAPTFLPRLGGPLTGIAPHPTDPASLLLRQADNTLRVVNTASMKVESSVLGLRPRPPGMHPTDADAATALSPGSGLLAVPTQGAALQLYDTTHHRHVALLQVAPRNPIATAPPAAVAALAAAEGGGRALAAHDDDAHAALAAGGQDAAGKADAWGAGVDPLAASEPRVSHAAFTHDGRCLVTVDVRPDAGPYGSSEPTLKFWDASAARSGTPAFALNTRVDDPHKGSITAVAVHPLSDVAVTCGGAAASATGQGGGEFRVWEKIPAPRRPGSKIEAPSCWRCRAVGAYKGLALTAASFSHDGSILAVAASHKVTLWDPATNTLAGVLPGPTELQYSSTGAEPYRMLAFVSGTPFLVGATACTLVVWNLLTASVHWALPLSVASLAADPTHAVFAAALDAGVLTAAVPEQPASAAAAAHAAGDKAHSDKGEKGGDKGDKGTKAKGQGRAAHEEKGEGPASAGTPAAAGTKAQGTEGAGTSADAGGPTSSDAAAAAGAEAAAARRVKRVGAVVLVFDPSSPTPLMGTAVPRTHHVGLSFVKPSMVQHAALAGGGVVNAPAISPLLVLSEGRAYAYLDPEGRAAARDAASAAAAGAQAGQQAVELSAFEAAFGAVTAVRAVGDEGDTEMGEGGALAGSGVPKWQALLDAPSHALPPPTALAHAFLTLLTSNANSS